MKLPQNNLGIGASWTTPTNEGLILGFSFGILLFIISIVLLLKCNYHIGIVLVVSALVLTLTISLTPYLFLTRRVDINGKKIQYQDYWVRWSVARGNPVVLNGLTDSTVGIRGGAEGPYWVVVKSNGTNEVIYIGMFPNRITTLFNSGHNHNNVSETDN